MRIVLDPGHGQYGNAGVIKPYYEGTQMFKLAYHLKDELEKYKNVETNVTRKKISDDHGLSTRGRMAKGYDLFLSLHSNAPGESARKAGTYNKIKGTAIYDSVGKPNKALATALGNEIARVMNHNLRGVYYRKGNIAVDYYTVIDSSIKAGCPSAMLIEHGYHTNPDDCAFLLKDENLKQIAKAEAEVIASHYKLQLKTPTPQPKPNPNILYRVQTGAFKEKKNADLLLDKVKNAGFDTYMVQANGLYKVQVGAYGVKANADAKAGELKSKGFDVYITTEGGSPVTPTTSKPVPTPVPKPQPTPKKTWEHYITGSIVRELQSELNKQFGKKLTIDGYLGDETIAALTLIRQGASGNLTKIVQQRLRTLGYLTGIASVDGKFGAITLNAVKKFQRDKKLTVDGVVGTETWKALFRR